MARNLALALLALMLIVGGYLVWTHWDQITAQSKPLVAELEKTKAEVVRLTNQPTQTARVVFQLQQVVVTAIPVSSTPTPTPTMLKVGSLPVTTTVASTVTMPLTTTTVTTVTAPITGTVSVTSTNPVVTPRVAQAGGMTQTVTSTLPLTTTTMGSWMIQYYKGITDQMVGWTFDPSVKDWSNTPNMDFVKYNFKAKDGLEWGMSESAYCQQGQLCDVNVPAGGYRMITADYEIDGVDTCSAISGDAGVGGCAIILVNVGDVTAMYRNSFVDYGFTVSGRYWNGDALPVAIRAALSNRAYEMLNVGGSVLGLSLPVNPGANCSSRFGCKAVSLTFVIVSGNEVLMKGNSILSR